MLLFWLPYSPIGLLADVNAPGHSGGLSAAGEIDRVAKEAIARHTIPNDAGDHLARMDANGDLLQKERRGQ